MDPTTRRPVFNNVIVLDNEPCDLARRVRRVASQGPGGTVFTSVNEVTLKIYPADITTMPDVNDDVFVNGSRHKVLNREDYFDGGSGSYRGSRLTIDQVVADVL